MPLIAIAERLSAKSYASREDMAEAVLEDLLGECPFLAEANASTLRNMVSIILDYNRKAADCGRPYRQLVTAHSLTGSAVVNSTFTFGFLGGNLTVVASENDHILKVCPRCNITACIGDPVCPGCNHDYRNHDKEETAITAALAAFGCMGKLAAAGSLAEAAQVTASNAVILDDVVEGFKVTEGDVQNQMKNVHKYMPGAK